MGGRCERMGPNDSRSGVRLAVNLGDGLNREGKRRDLSQMKDGTEKAGLFFVALGRAGRLEFQLRAARSRLVRSMMM